MNNSKEKNKCILAIETSCDDTSIAVLYNDILLANIVTSSASSQARYGGVVPELAARYHEQNIIPSFIQALESAEIDYHTITHIVYTSTPGLKICLNVGEAFAYTLGSLMQIEPIGINHIHSHIFAFANNLKSKLKYPFLSLVVSGGETCIFLVKEIDNIEILNQTQDDAVGECYDKIARELGYPYPGGPAIDAIYDSSKLLPNFIHKQTAKSLFSFSGLKTAILNYINIARMKNITIDPIAVASSFQSEIIDILITKLKYYSELYNNCAISIGGGVSANNLLRSRIVNEFQQKIYLPEKKLCGDNAGMIAIYANLMIK